jgi:hypothetical protein
LSRIVRMKKLARAWSAQFETTLRMTYVRVTNSRSDHKKSLGLATLFKLLKTVATSRLLVLSLSARRLQHLVHLLVRKQCACDLLLFRLDTLLKHPCSLLLFCLFFVTCYLFSRPSSLLVRACFRARTYTRTYAWQTRAVITKNLWVSLLSRSCREQWPLLDCCSPSLPSDCSILFIGW